jgi:hypothetical protein
VPIPTIDDFGQRVIDLRGRAERADRDPSTIEIICNGVWPMMDVRNGLNPEHMRDEIGHLTEIGTDWVVFNLCGDDVEASIETLEAVAAAVIS